MSNERLTAYLLQELTPEEAERFEDQCFAQDEWPVNLDAAEQELIDAYLFNQLSKDQRLRFQNNYLTTDARKTRVLMDVLLLRVLTQTPTKKSVSQTIRSFWDRPLVPQVGIGIVVLAIAIWFLSPDISYLSRLNESTKLIYLSLTSWDRPGGVRHQTVTVPLDRDALIIYLNPPQQSPDTTAYRIKWEDGTSASVLGEEKVAVTHSLRIRIPAAKLKPGQHVLKLYEIDRNGTERRVSGGYYFSAVEKTQ